jgi:hypothetical protein
LWADYRGIVLQSTHAIYYVPNDPMERIPLSLLVFRIANINDPVLKGKVAKAIGILQRTFALYK